MVKLESRIKIFQIFKMVVAFGWDRVISYGIGGGDTNSPHVILELFNK